MIGVLYLSLAAIVAGLSLWRPDGEYRTAALTIVGASVGTTLIYGATGANWTAFPLLITIVDGGAMAILGYLALTSKRFWPLWIASLQLVALFSHFSSRLAPNAASYAIGIIQGASGWVQLVILFLVGIALGTSPRQAT